MKKGKKRNTKIRNKKQARRAASRKRKRDVTRKLALGARLKAKRDNDKMIMELIQSFKENKENEQG